MDFPSFEEVEIEWDGDAFKKMKNLRTLIIRNGHFSTGPKHLPNSLRVMEWWRYPSQNFPQDFHPKKLSIFKLPYCEFTSLELNDLVKQASVLTSFPGYIYIHKFSFTLLIFFFFFYFAEVREYDKFKF